MNKKYHWFFNYEQKDYRIVSGNFEDAKQAMANLTGKTYEELSTPLIRACGTGACAAVVAGILNGYIDNSVDVNLMGGTVHIDWEGSNVSKEMDIYLTGPAEYVFKAELE